MVIVSTMYNNLDNIAFKMFYVNKDFEYLEVVHVRTDKANFGPSPISLIFSVKVNHYIQCTNIAFIQSNSIFFIFFEMVFI